VTLGTLTPGLVDHHGTDGVLTTGSSEAARVNTAASPAGLSDGTIEISSALSVRVRNTFYQRVSVRFISRADTEGVGCSGSESAESSESTGCDRAGVNEGSSAHTAGVAVSGTAGSALTTVASNQVLTDGVGSTGTASTVVLVFLALNIGVPDVVERTGAFLDMVGHSTLGVGSTGVRKLAEVDTASLHTGLG